MTSKQASVLRYIIDYIAENDGVSPSYDDIIKGVGLKSKGDLNRILNRLKERGYVHWIKRKYRSLVVLKHPDGRVIKGKKSPLRESLARSIERQAGDYSGLSGDVAALRIAQAIRSISL